MKTFLIFIFVALVVAGLCTREVRADVAGFFRFLWVPIVVAGIVAFFLFALAYGGETFRLF